VVPCAREPRRPPWASLSLSLPLTRALPRLDLPVSVLACDVRQPIKTFGRELEFNCSTEQLKKKIRSKQPKNPRAPAARSVETAASTVMDRYVELVKQWPGQQQVNLAVEIQVPGSWFGVGPMGCLTATERREKYTAQAVEYCEVREFPGATKGARKIKEKAIRFICLADAADAPNSEGYWMQLSQWNRFRNDTFKDRRDDELPFIPGQAPAAEGGVAVKAPQTPTIKTVFTLKSEDVHTQSNGTKVQCFWWTCVQKGCKLDGRPIKEICKGTGQLFRHLKTCNNDLWLQLQLSSKHSGKNPGGH